MKAQPDPTSARGKLREAAKRLARRQLRERIRTEFRLLCKANGLPMPTTEYRFHPSRRWMFDYAWPKESVALEQEGGVWTRGRHTRGSGFLRDVEKYNAAAVLGWRLLRVTPDTLQTAETITMLRAALAHPTPEAL